MSVGALSRDQQISSSAELEPDARRSKRLVGSTPAGSLGCNRWGEPTSFTWIFCHPERTEGSAFCIRSRSLAWLRLTHSTRFPCHGCHASQEVSQIRCSRPP